MPECVAVEDFLPLAALALTVALALAFLADEEAFLATPPATAIFVADDAVEAVEPEAGSTCVVPA